MRYPEKYKDADLPIYVNGFTMPTLPVITKEEAGMKKWGFIPGWVNDNEKADKMAKMCLNARLESADNKPAFRDAFHNHQRCIIPACSFFEWRWEDEKGKTKTKYEIEVVGEEMFYFGGLYSDWLNKETGELIQTFTILTCAANELMEYIHNNKKRMPTILKEAQANDWLENTMSGADLTQCSRNQDLDGAPLQ